MTPYEQGFLDKCAELGVDPTALVKQAMKKMSPKKLVAIFNNPKLLARLRDVPRRPVVYPRATVENVAHSLWDKGIEAERVANLAEKGRGVLARLFGAGKGKVHTLRQEQDALFGKSRALSERARQLPVSKAVPEEVWYNQEQLGALAGLRDGIAAGQNPLTTLHHYSLAHADYPRHSMLSLDVVRALEKSRPDLFGVPAEAQDALRHAIKPLGDALGA